MDIDNSYIQGNTEGFYEKDFSDVLEYERVELKG